MAGFLDPPQPDQAGSDTIDTAVDLRPTDALWQDNRFVFPSTYPCGAGPDDCVRVTEFDTTGASATVEPTLTQDFLVHDSGKDVFMGGIGLTGNGTLHVGWTMSSASDDPSSFTAHQALGDTLGSISAPEQLGAGSGPYAGERWGDYVGIAQDPQVPDKAWDGNQYSDGSDWLTQITPLQTAATTYNPIAPFRVLDTRVNNGLSGAFTANVARSWQVGGRGDIPDGAVAVTGNIAVTGQTAAGYVAVTSNPTTTPLSSTINFPTGDTRANNVTVPLSATGTLSAVFKAGAGKKVHVIFDVTGYFLADDSGATFTTLVPTRALDTRNGTGLSGDFLTDVHRTLPVAGLVPGLGIPDGATAITGNLAIVSPSKAGYAAVTKDPTDTPTTATINFPAGAIRANGVFAPLDADGAISIVYKASPGGAHRHGPRHHRLLRAGHRRAAVRPAQPVTDHGQPLVGPVRDHRVVHARAVPKTLAVQGHWGVPVDAEAVTGNLTVTAQTGAGYVSVTPGSDAHADDVDDQLPARRHDRRTGSSRR